MPRANQGYGGFPPPNTRKEYSHGCGRGRCSSQVWDVVVQIMGSQHHTTIPVFGALKHFYKDSLLAYMINNKENPNNHPIYSVNTDMGSSILFNEVVPQKDEP